MLRLAVASCYIDGLADKTVQLPAPSALPYHLLAAAAKPLQALLACCAERGRMGRQESNTAAVCGAWHHGCTAMAASDAGGGCFEQTLLTQVPSSLALIM